MTNYYTVCSLSRNRQFSMFWPACVDSDELEDIEAVILLQLKTIKRQVAKTAELNRRAEYYYGA